MNAGSVHMLEFLNANLTSFHIYIRVLLVVMWMDMGFLLCN